MNRFVFAIFFVLLTSTLFANRIDNLKTDNDVIEFLKSINPDFSSVRYNQIELRSTETLHLELNCDSLADKWQVKNWEKADFNEDGLTDLSVILYWYNYGLYVIMDTGNDDFRLIQLSYNIHEKCKLIKPIISKGQQLLLFTEKRVIDTLIYRYYGFIELNRNPIDYGIDSIEFRTGACYNNCPVFSIRIDKNRNAVYEAGMYSPKQGKFSSALEYDKSEAIFDLIKYMDVKKLNDTYSVSWPDDQTCWLTVKFSDGTIKVIRDYGLKGTFGLRMLYSIFLDLRMTQEWK